MASRALELTEADIVAAYRLILGRQPDQAEVAYYVEVGRNKRLSPLELAQLFLTSDERAALENSFTEIDVAGLSLLIDPNDPDFGRHLASTSEWEPHVASIIKRSLGPGDVFVDVGANVGFMTFTAATAVGSAGKVIAFEPNPRNAQLLLRSILKNAIGSYVNLHQLACSNKTSLVNLMGGSNSYITSGSGKVGTIVQTVIGDEVLYEEPRVSMIKFDIEGHEPFAWAGLSKTRRRHRPCVVMEFNPRCLVAASHAACPEEFAKELHAEARRVSIVERDGELTAVEGAAELMAQWSRRDEQATLDGILEPGMLHFDLLIEPH